MTAANDTAPIARLLRLSGWLELTLGTGHNVVSTLMLTHPAVVAPVFAVMRWPATLAEPIVPAQLPLVLAMSIGSGTAWMVFGAILLWQASARAASPDVPLLQLVWLHQVSFALLMVLFVRWHLLAIAVVFVMLIALSRAVILARRSR
jgi:hypothetical protein